MEPGIKYAQTKDGVSIAFTTHGEGVPLVSMPAGPGGNIEMEGRVLAYRSWLDDLAKGRTVISYDVRGSGLSGGEHASTIEDMLLDLDAVADQLQLDRFDLLSGSFTGPVAITYVVQNPDRVSHLVLWCTAAKGAKFFGSDRDRAMSMLMRTDWKLYTETVAHLTYGWSAGEAARQFAARMRETSAPEQMRELYRGVLRLDATELLPAVSCPTLVVHRRQNPFFGADVARELAAKIPGARLTLLEGESIAPYVGDWEGALAAINEFLGEGEGEMQATEAPVAGAVHTILFTDVEGSTALTQRLGDTKSRDVLREHERMVREALKSHAGSEVKTMGDGFMASFFSATRALECAIAMQRAFAQHNESAEEPIRVRIGLNAGEPIAEEDDLFGTTVIEAARITGAAKGGEILVANVVRELAKGKEFLFADRGETSLRGFEDPVRLFEVRWQEEG